MNKALIGLWIATSLFQVLISIGLLVVSYGDGFGLGQIAANGKTILELIAQIDQRAISQTSSGGQNTVDLLRPLLTTTNQAFQQLSGLLGWVAFAFLISVVLQLAVLIALGRRITWREKSTQPKSD